jgi:ribonucleoside-diphosphate reductase beta chain
MFRTIKLDDADRFHLHPIVNGAVWELYEAALACVWTPNDLTWTDDRRDYETLSAREQELLKHTMAFFAFADHVVADAVGEFKIPCMEIKFFHDLQVMVENVHHTVYAQSIAEIMPHELTSMLERVRTHPSLMAKRTFLEGMDSTELPMQLLIWACMEGIAFAGAFAVIFFFKDKSKMPGLAAANHYIARDEAMHRDFAVHLLKDLSTPLPLHIIKATVHAFVEQEKLYYADFRDVLDIGQYSEFVGNQLLNALSAGSAPSGVCPLPFMATVSLKSESNFFEVLPVEYEETPGEVQWGDIGEF